MVEGAGSGSRGLASGSRSLSAVRPRQAKLVELPPRNYSRTMIRLAGRTVLTTGRRVHCIP